MNSRKRQGSQGLQRRTGGSQGLQRKPVRLGMRVAQEQRTKASAVERYSPKRLSRAALERLSLSLSLSLSLFLFPLNPNS